MFLTANHGTECVTLLSKISLIFVLSDWANPVDVDLSGTDNGSDGFPWAAQRIVMREEDN